MVEKGSSGDAPMIDEIRAVLKETLHLGDRAARLDARSGLFGSLPELDSNAVVGLVVALEERFGITVHDDEISAETFATVGSLVRFVERKLGRAPGSS
jgi:acyl carrier protein